MAAGSGCGRWARGCSRFWRLCGARRGTVPELRRDVCGGERVRAAHRTPPCGACALLMCGVAL
eukprot:scaffold12303_cov230-Isochrysis_galbana.AAC.1